MAMTGKCLAESNNPARRAKRLRGGRHEDRCFAMPTAKECLESAEVCLALAHKVKNLETRAALLVFAYEFRTVAKLLQREERKLMVRAISDGIQK
jgi:hypothetical protein